MIELDGFLVISEIAYRAGFKSAAHFARMFKRQFDAFPDCSAPDRRS